jgi:hypothetical protein
MDEELVVIWRHYIDIKEENIVVGLALLKVDLESIDIIRPAWYLIVWSRKCG